MLAARLRKNPASTRTAVSVGLLCRKRKSPGGLQALDLVRAGVLPRAVLVEIISSVSNRVNHRESSFLERDEVRASASRNQGSGIPTQTRPHKQSGIRRKTRRNAACKSGVMPTNTFGVACDRDASFWTRRSASTPTPSLAYVQDVVLSRAPDVEIRRMGPTASPTSLPL